MLSNFLGIALKNVVLGLRTYLRMTFIKIRWHEDPNGTHSDFLTHVIQHLHRLGPLQCIEIGCGNFSTPMLAQLISQNPKSHLISFENNEEWFEKVFPIMRDKFQCDIRLVGSYKNSLQDFVESDNSDIDLVFIDSSPWESRVEALEIFRNEAKVVVVHDVDYFPHNNIFGTELEPIKFPLLHLNLKPYFNYSRVGVRNYDSIFKFWVEIFPRVPSSPTGPPTLVGSNSIDVREFFRGDDAPRKGLYVFSTQEADT